MDFKHIENRFRIIYNRIFFSLGLLAVSFYIATHPADVKAAPKLSSYFKTVPGKVVDSSYLPRGIAWDLTVDINSDGHQDYIVFGQDFPSNGATTYSPQPSRVLLGDGEGGFVIAPSNLFPVETLNTILAAKVVFADFNADGRPDMFVACSGWDADPWPGEQNKLFLSKKNGGWADATANLPQLNDYSHSAAVGDINGDDKIDIFVGNINGGNPPALPYTLLNNGDGQFSLNRNNIPAGDNELLDHRTGFTFTGSNLIDLDGDNLPELIITAAPGPDNTSSDERTHSTILWNDNGSLGGNGKTVLPAPSVFAYSHLDLDVQSFDINQDGLMDLVVTGTQGIPSYDGWFVQILINQGNSRFIDETASRLAHGDRFGGTVGLPTRAPRPISVKVLDFNHDGFTDFTVELTHWDFEQSQPIIWLNDGKGQFETLKVGDFVAPEMEWQLGAINHMTQTKKGYSFFHIAHDKIGDYKGLGVFGLLAKRPYGIPNSAMNPIFMLLLK